MTIQEAIHKIFAQYPEKLFTADKLRDLVKAMTSHYPAKNKFQKEFLMLRQKQKPKEGERRIVRIYEQGQWKYIRTKNKYYLGNHNANHDRAIKSNEEMKVLINNS